MRIVKLIVVLGACTQICLCSYSKVPDPGLPRSLSKMLASRYAGYRVVDIEDIPKEFLESEYDGSPQKPPGIACADYDGNGELDYALLLVNPKEMMVRIIVALSRKSSWQMEDLERFSLCTDEKPPTCASVGEYHLEVLPPGEYGSMLADSESGITAEMESLGYRAKYSSKKAGLYWGKFETEGTAFFRGKSKWVRLVF